MDGRTDLTHKVSALLRRNKKFGVQKWPIVDKKSLKTNLTISLLKEGEVGPVRKKERGERKEEKEREYIVGIIVM